VVFRLIWSEERKREKRSASSLRVEEEKRARRKESRTNESSEDSSGGLDTSGKRSNIEEEEILGLLGGVSREDGGLNGGSVGDGLIGVDGPVGLLSREEVGDEPEGEGRKEESQLELNEVGRRESERDSLLDLGDSGRSTNEDDLVNRGLVHLGVLEDLLDAGERKKKEEKEVSDSRRRRRSDERDRRVRSRGGTHGSIVPRKRSWQSSSNRARVREV